MPTDEKKEKGTLESGGLIFVFDGVVSETHAIESRVTEYPMESGAAMSDGAIDLPISVSIRGVVSDRPISVFGNDTFNDGESRSRTAFDELLKIRRNKEPVRLHTSLGTYPSMLIEKIQVDRRVDSMALLDVSMTLRQIDYKESGKRKSENLDGPEAEQQGSSPIDVGKAKPTPMTPEDLSPVQKFLRAFQ